MLDKKENFPIVSKTLLDSLNELFPNRVPYIYEEDREIWMLVGARKVIDLLQSHYDNQNEGIDNVRP